MKKREALKAWAEGHLLLVHKLVVRLQKSTVLIMMMNLQ